MHKVFTKLPDEQAKLDQNERLLDQVALQTPPASPVTVEKKPVGRPRKVSGIIVRPSAALASLQARKARATRKHAEPVCC